jgi:hypothetical protein
MSDKFECACDYNTYGNHSIACHDREIEWMRARQNKQRDVMYHKERAIVEAADAWAKGWEPFISYDALTVNERALYEAVLDWRGK